MRFVHGADVGSPEEVHSASQVSFHPGLQLLDRYELVRLLATGGMGTVWLARNLELDSPVAIKWATRLGGVAQARFLDEAKTAANLVSPHTVRVYDIGTYSGSPFLVMEYLQGETLGERLRAVGRLTPASTASIISQVASGLEEAHAAGIVHRDLKPDNIFLSRSADNVVAKLLDFGVAKTVGADSLRPGEVVGTPSYLSPEQSRDSRRVDARSDLWALALIAYECITGRRAYPASSVTSLLQALNAGPPPPPSALGPVPHLFDAWFTQAAAQEPHLRFPTVREFSRTLQVALGSECLNPGLKTCDATLDGKHQEGAPRQVQNSRRWLIASVLLGGIGAAWLLQRGDPSSSSAPTPSAKREVEKTSGFNELEQPKVLEVSTAIDVPREQDTHFLPVIQLNGVVTRHSRAPSAAQPKAKSTPPSPRKKLKSKSTTDTDDLWGVRK